MFGHFFQEKYIDLRKKYAQSKCIFLIKKEEKKGMIA
jgi:hypothetical protein